MKRLILLFVSMFVASSSLMFGQADVALQKSADAKCQKRLGRGWYAVGVDAEFPHGSSCRQRDEVTIYLYSKPDDRQEFMSAFAAESACHGVVFVSDSAKATGERYRVHYYGSSFVNAQPATLQTDKPYTGYIVSPKGGSDLDFSGKSIAAAVRQVCIIVTGKGGTIR